MKISRIIRASLLALMLLCIASGLIIADVEPLDLGTLDFVYNGEPYNSVPSNGQDLGTLDYVFNGEPFSSNWYTEPTPTPTPTPMSIYVTIYATPMWSEGITGFVITYISDTQLDLDWSYDVENAQIMIRAKYGDYPDDIPDSVTAPTDGYLVYYGDGIHASDTTMDFDENPGKIYYKAWLQYEDGTWEVEPDTGSEESRQVILIGLIVLTLGLSAVGSALKNGVLTWASVPFWIILGIYLNANYTWLGEAQWVFIMLGFGLAAGMAFETTTYRTKVDDEETGDEIDPELQAMIAEREKYDNMKANFKKVTRGNRVDREDRKLGEKY